MEGRFVAGQVAGEMFVGKLSVGAALDQSVVSAGQVPRVGGRGRDSGPVRDERRVVRVAGEEDAGLLSVLMRTAVGIASRRGANHGDNVIGLAPPG